MDRAKVVFCNDARRKVPFRTVFGFVHVTHAFFFLLILQAVLEAAESIRYIAAKESVSNIGEFAYDVFETFVLLSMIIAWHTENSTFVVPYIIQCIVSLVFITGALALTVFAFFFPMSSLGELLNENRRTSPGDRRVIALMAFIVTLPFLFFCYWALKVALSTHHFYVHKATMEMQRRLRPLPSVNEGAGDTPRALALVRPATVSTEEPGLPAVGNFGNPNFSPSDDEEELFNTDGHARHPGEMV